MGSGYKHELDAEVPLRPPNRDAEYADDQAAGVRGESWLRWKCTSTTSSTKRWGLMRQGVVGQMRTVLGAVAQASRYKLAPTAALRDNRCERAPHFYNVIWFSFPLSGSLGFLFPLSPVKPTAVCVSLSPRQESTASFTRDTTVQLGTVPSLSVFSLTASLRQRPLSLLFRTGCRAHRGERCSQGQACVMHSHFHVVSPQKRWVCAGGPKRP